MLYLVHLHGLRHQELEVLGEDVVIDADIPGPIYGNPNVPGKDQIGRSGPSYTFRPKPPLRDGPDPDGPGPGGNLIFDYNDPSQI